MWRVKCPTTKTNARGDVVEMGASSVWKFDEGDARALAALAPDRTVERVTGDAIPAQVRKNAEAKLARDAAASP